MPKEILLDERFPHGLGTADEAVKRLQKLLPGLASRFSDQISDLKQEWSGNRATFSFKVKGISVSGTLTITDANICLVGKASDIPFLYRMVSEATIKGLLAEKIAEQLREMRRQ